MMNWPILFILGPSGAGKTTLGESLASELGMLHIDFDQWPENGVDQEALRSEWEAFLAGDPRCLADAIQNRIRTCARHGTGARHGAVVTCPSTLILRRSFFEAVAPHGFRFVILYGTGAECLAGFLRREKASRRGFGEDHWIQNNAQTYAEYSRTEFNDYRLPAFTVTGYRPYSEMSAEIQRRLAE